MDRNKKNLIASISIVITISIIVGFLVFYKNKNKENLTDSDEVEIENNIENDTKKEEILTFLNAVSGVNAKNIELEKNPVAIQGEFLVPKESILNAVDYFIKDTENDKMEEITIDIGDGYIDIKTTYNVNSFISTPIMIRVAPNIDNEQNLVLEISQVKFLDMKVADWIVDLVLENFIKDWFPKDGEFKAEFKDGYVNINKDNFKGIDIQNLEIKSTGLSIKMNINLEEVL